MPHPAVMVHPRLAVCPALRRLPPRGAGAVGQAVRVMAAIVLLTAAAPSRAAEPARGTPLLAPVTPACISSPFGPRVLPNRPLAGTFHPGIDLPAPVGAPVRAVAAGRVIRAQRHGPGGLEMLVQHDGFVGVYSHLGHVAPPIAEGRLAVTAGQPIATVGRSGVTYGAHLYFGMLVGGKPVDPAPWLDLTHCGVPEADAGDHAAGAVPPPAGSTAAFGPDAPKAAAPLSKSVAGR
ncbi:MAG: M23 family metallopeptidase [Rhodospirillales bacterium]|nr:M23 family metallopeptidase [Rhodospirillales bacterium]